VEFSALCAVALVDEDEDFADGAAGGGFQFADEGVKVIDIISAEFMHQGAEKAGAGLGEEIDQFPAAAGAFDGFAGFAEHALNLLVELIAVRDDGDAGVGMILQNPFGEEHHDDAFAAALGVPDDAAFAFGNVLLGGFDGEILVDARDLLYAAVEEDKIVDQFQEAALFAYFQQVLVEFEAGIVLLVLLPLEEVFFLRFDGSVLEAFGVTAGEEKLDGGEEPGIEFGLLVGEALANSVADGDAAVFEFDEAEGDAVPLRGTELLRARMLPAPAS